MSALAKEPSDYTDPHSLAIRAANWAMRDDPECAIAFRRQRAAKAELEAATRHEVPAAREAFSVAYREWLAITRKTFDRVIVEKGFVP